MTTKFSYGDFFGMTESGLYVYTIALPQGGFTFEMYPTRQH